MSPTTTAKPNREPRARPHPAQFLGSVGSPLSDSVRTSMEARLGSPLDDVALHTDAAAAKAAASVTADAFSVGRHVVFGQGRFDPTSTAGSDLLAHELAHVVRASKQARQSTPARLPPIDDTAENGARTVAANGVHADQPASESLAVRRQASSATSPTVSSTPESPAALPTISPNASVAEMAVSMRMVDAIVPSQVASGMFATVYQGRTINLNSDQVAEVRKTAKDSLTSALSKSKARANDAIARYKAQEATNAEFPATSRAVKAWAWVSSLGSYSNPRESVYGEATTASMAAVAAELALNAGHFAEAIEMVAKCDAASERTSKLVYAYIDQLLEGGDNLVTGLEFTRNAAALTVGVLAVVVTGGAALGLEASVVGTGVGGLTVAQTATAISVGAPIVASLSEAGVKTALGDKVDWPKVGVDIAVQVILAKFGGKLGAGIASKIAGPATQSLARQAISSLSSGTATHVMSQAFTHAVDSVYWTFRGREVTWEDYVDGLAKSLADPTGWFMVALGSGVQTAAQVKVANALNASKQPPIAAAPKEPTTTVAPKQAPTGLVPKKATTTDGSVEPPLAAAGKEPPATTKEPTSPTSAKRRGRPKAPDDVIDDFIKRLDEPGNPFELDVSKKRAAAIARGDKDFALDTPTSFDVDEPLPVGAKNIKPGRAVARALDPHDRQLLDSPTNRVTKHLGERDADVARHRTRLKAVSVKDDPSSIMSRRFDEVTELNQVFDEAVQSVRNKSSLKPTELKDAINKQVRAIIKNGSSPAGAAVRDALHSLGFEYVPRRGFVAVKRD